MFNEAGDDPGKTFTKALGVVFIFEVPAWPAKTGGSVVENLPVHVMLIDSLIVFLVAAANLCAGFGNFSTRTVLITTLVLVVTLSIWMNVRWWMV